MKRFTKLWDSAATAIAVRKDPATAIRETEAALLATEHKIPNTTALY
ncbi:MAG: hypothetical protein ACI4NE_07420 [Succinivibrio sp.]